METDKHQVIEALAALAHPLRLDVFRLLVVAGQQGMTPGALMEASGVDKGATISTYLRDLGAAGLVTQIRQGRHVVYRAAYDRMNAVLAFLTENCCRGEAAAAPAEAGDSACGC